MSDACIHDEDVAVSVERNRNRISVPFCEIKKGDIVMLTCGIPVQAAEDARVMDGVTYLGWRFYSVEGDDYYPEDFGASQVWDIEDQRGYHIWRDSLLQ